MYVINDFNSENGCIEFHSYGNGRMEIFTSFKTKSKHRGFQLKEDCIDIFLNYKKVASIKNKEETKKILTDVLNNCPKECKRDFEEWSWEILSVIE